MQKKLALLIAGFLLALSACGDVATLSVDAGMGTHPTLPQPNTTLIPIVNIAPAVGWPLGRKPIPVKGLAVNAYASGLDHPRWIYVLPNGDVLVAETNAPAKPEDGEGIKGVIMEMVMKRAGAGLPLANRITLLRVIDANGVVQTRSIFLAGLNSPFGMVLVDGNLYVADTDAVLRFPYKEGKTQITEPVVKLLDLPAGPINNHWIKNIIVSRDGSRLDVTVGSNSNVAENGMENEVHRAAILEVDRLSGRMRVFASSLRNPNGLVWEPKSGTLWTTVNERDELGSDLVPDYMNSVKEGAFYGWPYSYYGHYVDIRMKPPRPDLVASAISPDYALGPNTASLGLAFNDKDLLLRQYAVGAFVGQHGSWNRKPQSGYKLVFIPFLNCRPADKLQDVLTRFLSADGNAYGRPDGVALDRFGALLVANDVGNTIWRVTPATTR